MRSKDLKTVSEFGFHLNVMLDLSHNTFFETIGTARNSYAVMAKPIELDCQLSIAGTPDYAGYMKKLMSGSGTSPMQDFARQLSTRSMTKRVPLVKEFEDLMTSHKVKLEFPDFDASVAAVDSFVEGTDVARAVAAATAATMDEFDQLDVATRSSMGMYARTTATSFSRSGSGERIPRIAHRRA
ncbi:hypothetical protein [Tateyamaria sp. SN6-1]|uniref:hypothetical protein n=1 Tax=Tateyamaria sp. SN6-1 TaxID=3092148 RepID=UPI0039F56AF8